MFCIVVRTIASAACMCASFLIWHMPWWGGAGWMLGPFARCALVWSAGLAGRQEAGSVVSCCELENQNKFVGILFFCRVGRFRCFVSTTKITEKKNEQLSVRFLAHETQWNGGDFEGLYAHVVRLYQGGLWTVGCEPTINWKKVGEVPWLVNTGGTETRKKLTYIKRVGFGFGWFVTTENPTILGCENTTQEWSV